MNHSIVKHPITFLWNPMAGKIHIQRFRIRIDSQQSIAKRTQRFFDCELQLCNCRATNCLDAEQASEGGQVLSYGVTNHFTKRVGKLITDKLFLAVKKRSPPPK